jgi:small subunit ribosomal protein S17
MDEKNENDEQAEVEEPEAPADEPAAEAEEAPAAEEPAAEAGAPAKPRKSRAERKARAKRRAEAKARGKTASAERKPIVRTPKPNTPRALPKERRGVVVSSAMDKTIVVRVDSSRPHPTYKKVVRRSRKFHAHDEENAASVGDVVRIVESRPLSKSKHWRLAEILEVAK